MACPRRWTRVLGACSLALAVADTGQAAVLYSQNFDVDDTVNWMLNEGPSDETANFFFDYSQAGIPSAPNSAGSTRGLKLQANLTAGVFGGFSVSPIGQSFSGNHTLSFDWWSNFNGPAPVGGNGSTQLSTFGVLTSGTAVQWPGGTQDSIWFGATGDGNSATDWRAYSPTAGTGYSVGSNVYAAGSGAGANNSSHPYYASFGTVSAPAPQMALFPQQTGTTLVGSTAFEWHDVEITRQGTLVAWTVDGLLIATVPAGDDAVATGNNFFFGHSDTNAAASSDPNDVNLLFTLIDNVHVDSIFIPGDFDEDSDVDVTDYLTLVAHLHTDVSALTPEQSYPFGNITGDREINGHDFLGFLKAFDDANGVGALQALLTAVPEPSCLGLAVVVLAYVAAVRPKFARRAIAA